MAADPRSLSKQDILAQLKKEGVEDLEGLVDYVTTKTRKDGDPGKPMVNNVFMVSHGFVSH